MGEKIVKTGLPPVVEMKALTFEESSYVRGKKKWLATTLLRECHEKQLEPFEVPLASLDLSIMPFSVDSLDSFIWQMKRCMGADYEQHPIILDDLGQIADGNHRICKAILEGRRTILAYRLQEMPEPDFVDESNGK